MEYERVADEVAAPHQRSCAPVRRLPYCRAGCGGFASLSDHGLARWFKIFCCAAVGLLLAASRC